MGIKVFSSKSMAPIILFIFLSYSVLLHCITTQHEFGRKTWVWLIFDLEHIAGRAGYCYYFCSWWDTPLLFQDSCEYQYQISGWRLTAETDILRGTAVKQRQQNPAEPLTRTVVMWLIIMLIMWWMPSLEVCKVPHTSPLLLPLSILHCPTCPK